MNHRVVVAWIHHLHANDRVQVADRLAMLADIAETALEIRTALIETEDRRTRGAGDLT